MNAGLSSSDFGITQAVAAEKRGGPPFEVPQRLAGDLFLVVFLR